MKKRSVFNDVCNSRYTDPGKLKSRLYNSTRSSKDFVQRFGLLKSLAVHEGCVNTITWDENGEYLLSGSDDQQLSITNAHTFKMKAQYRTPHRANIFSAKWLPCSSNKKIVSCSGDGAIIYTELLPEDRRHCNLFNCSNGTTYDIITLPKDPNSFMSCSEDGSVRSYDLRIRSSCTKSHCIDSILLQLSLPVTAIAVNDMYPHQIAIGGSDNIVRTYDRRMIRTPLNDRTDVYIQKPVYIFQLPVKEERFYRITSLCYSPEGNDILVNYSSESLYLFSVNGCGTNFKLNTNVPPFEPFNLQPPAMPKIRRLRLRGDWSDTGPDARPEREGPSIGQVRPQLQSSVMQRMTNVLTRMLNDPATRAALAAGGEDMLSDESRILNPPSAAVASSRIITPPPAGVNQLRIINLPTGATSLPTVINDSPIVQNDSRVINPPTETVNESRILNPSVEAENEARVLNPSAALEATNSMLTNSQDNKECHATNVRTENDVSHKREPSSSEESSITNLSPAEESLLKESSSIGESSVGSSPRDDSSSRGRSPARSLPSELLSSPREESLSKEQASHSEQSSPKEQSLAREQLRHSEHQTTNRIPLTSEGDTQRPFKHARRRKIVELNGVTESPESAIQSHTEVTPDKTEPTPIDKLLTSAKQTNNIQLTQDDTVNAKRYRQNATNFNAGCSITTIPTKIQSPKEDPSTISREEPPSEKPQNSSMQTPPSCDKDLTSHSESGTQFGASASGELEQSPIPTPKHTIASASTSAQSSALSEEPTASTSSDNPHERVPNIDRRENVSSADVSNSDSTNSSEVRYYPFNTIPDGVELDDHTNINIYVTNLFDEVNPRRQGVQNSEASRKQTQQAINPGESLPSPPIFRPSRNKGRGLDYIDYSNVREASVRQKFSGHRNTRTLIKKASFYGNDFIMSGSDCGHVFIWDRHTGELVKLLQADQHVVNCVQPHPYLPLLATSGIDYDVKLWAPVAEHADHDEESIKTLLSRNSLMMEETRDTVTVPASFMIRMLSCIHSLRSGARQPRRRPEGNEDSSN